MQLTRFADYSLRALIYLAQREGLNTTIADIASAHRISKSHLMKVIHNLAKQGYVRTTRGKGGGISWRTHPRKSSLEKSFGMWSRSHRSNVSFQTMLVDVGCIPTVVFAGHFGRRNFDSWRRSTGTASVTSWAARPTSGKEAKHRRVAESLRGVDE